MRGKFSSGDTLTENLAALQKSKLIMEYMPFGESTARYKVADPLCIFYLNQNFASLLLLEITG